MNINYICEAILYKKTFFLSILCQPELRQVKQLVLCLLTFSNIIWTHMNQRSISVAVRLHQLIDYVRERAHFRKCTRTGASVGQK